MAADRVDAGHRLAGGAPQVIEAVGGERPQFLRVLQSDALDDALDMQRKAGRHDALAAVGDAPRDAAGFEHRHGTPARCKLARCGQSGDAATDHTDVYVEVEGKRRARRQRVLGRAVSARRVGSHVCRSHRVTQPNSRDPRVVIARTGLSRHLRAGRPERQVASKSLLNGAPPS
jgi:hypothetical protein